MDFPEWLKTTRNARGFTLLSLAEAAEVEPSTVQRIEKRERGPSRKMVGRLARALATDGASEEEIERIVADALLAAGFLPSPGGKPEIERLPDETILAQIESYDGENETLRGFKGFLKARAESHEVPPPDDIAPM